jgi:hypothetical protein
VEPDHDSLWSYLGPRVQPHPGELVFLCRVSEVRSLLYIRLR